MAKPRLSPWSLWNMSFGFLGIQFGWGLQLANMSAIYSKLGADPDRIPLLWLAGPVTGLLVQPVVGAMSDRTWNRLGRRRPYFLSGAVLASAALFVMPDAPALWVAAALLWVLDAAINVSMEPFRAFVADKLGPAQRTAGFAMQSFFIGVGATLANALPYTLRRAGVEGTTSTGVPRTVWYAFKLGAAVYLLAVLWTVVTSREEPPRDLAEFRRRNAEARGLGPWVREIAAAVAEMPAAMRQLAWVQVFTWFGLFCMWMFFGLSTARHVFGAASPDAPGFDRGVEWGGVCFAVYSAVCFLAAFALPGLAAATSRRAVHAVALACGGAGLLAVYVIRTPGPLLLSMAGVGVAWASVLAMPYAILAGALPPARMGLYMGVFNFFIVLPEVIASLALQPLLRHVFANDPRRVVMLGGASMLAAAVLAMRVRDPAPAAVRT